MVFHNLSINTVKYNVFVYTIEVMCNNIDSDNRIAEIRYCDTQTRPLLLKLKNLFV